MFWMDYEWKINLLNWAWFDNEIFRWASVLWRGSRKHWVSICFPWLPYSVSCKFWVMCAALSLATCSCTRAAEEDNPVALCSAPSFLARLWSQKERIIYILLGAVLPLPKCSPPSPPETHGAAKDRKKKKKEQTNNRKCEILEAVQFGLVRPIAENASGLQAISWVPYLLLLLAPVERGLLKCSS